MPGNESGTYLAENSQDNNSRLTQSGKIIYVGAIDIGTNSTHLLIAAVDTFLQTFSIEFAEKSTTRLGEKDPLSGKLTDIAISRTLETLKRFKDLAESYNVENLLTAATSAVREAPNGDHFVDLAKDKIDLDIEIISGTEEARLIYLGVISGMQFENRPHLLIDIGGGSTELILADANDSKALTSTKIGAVRLKRDFVNKEPLSLKDHEFLKTYIQGSFEPAVDKISRRIKSGKPPLMVATSGTAMAIGSLLISQFKTHKTKLQGYKVSKLGLDQLAENILKMDSDQLRKLTPLSERRAEIIVPGILILQTIMKMMEVEEVILSERALREGLVVDWMFRNGFLQDRFSLQGSIRQRTVLHQAKRFGVNLIRSEKVAKYALTLYDNTKGVLHSDDGKGRELLWAASILHCCGQHINLASYHKHSWYLIRHGELLGYSQLEHFMVAGIARYHRKSFPKKRHEAWQCIDSRIQRKVVSEMSMLLRLSASLDRRPEPVLSSIEVEAKNNEVIIKLIPVDAEKNLGLEKWSIKNILEYCGENIKPSFRILS
ncbi:Ppx/GppA phosphatase family protein [Prochlorococcus sp. MIT 1223]|uniref:Ppx/GppA phosphatase family protein n=1 Tax=Prochlorococcus sp. MIT 1223 TaxID=3096217 RepID=UPI002A74F441|nr:Ppx/GppA phosphatase family protein [Prochlorococcus sp. MIT 1223]